MQCDGIQGGGLFMVLYLLLKAEVRLKGYYMKPQSLTGMGRVHWSYRLPLLWTTVGGEL